MYAIIQGFCKTVSVGMAVVKTIMEGFRGRTVRRKQARVRMPNTRRDAPLLRRQGLGEGDHTSTKDQDSRNFQSPHCQTPLPKPAVGLAGIQLCHFLQSGHPCQGDTPIPSFPPHLSQEGTPWDFESSPFRKAEFSKVQNPLKRNRKRAALTL